MISRITTRIRSLAIAALPLLSLALVLAAGKRWA